MFMRSRSQLGAAILRSLSSETATTSWEGLSFGMNAAASMAMRCDAGHAAPRVLQHCKQNHAFSTFASRLHLQQQSLRQTWHQHNVAHNLFHVSGPQSSSRLTWSKGGRTISTLTPDNVVLGIMAVNGAVFIAWQQPSMRQFMTQHFTGTSQLPTLPAGSCEEC